MAKLPSLTAAERIQALKQARLVEDRQKGSHLILIHPETKARTVVPVHPGRTVKESLLRAIIPDARFGVEEFIELL